MLAEKSPVMKKATLRLIELSADEKARHLYEARLKESRDNYARQKAAEERGEKRGKKMGEEIGKQIGEQIGKQIGKQMAITDMAKNALQMKMPIDDIIRLTGLSHEEIESLLNAD